MNKFILTVLTAIMMLSASAAVADVGFGVTDGNVEVRAQTGGVGLGLLIDGTAGQSQSGIDFTELELGAKLLLPVGSKLEGPGGTVQPLFWTSVTGDFTRFDKSQFTDARLENITDKRGQFMLGAEYRPVKNFGLTAGAGVEWLIADQDRNDTFGTAASLGVLVYFGS